MIPIAELKNKHASWPGVVLGGGPSLMRDMKHISPGAVLIAVNHHGLDQVQADYIVYLDDLMNTPEKWKQIHANGGLIVSRQQESDVDLGGSDWWQARFSGQLACWFACWIGCDPVILCGMDLYRNPPPTVEEVKNLAYQAPLEEHLKEWRLAFTKCQHPERIKAVSGPLVKIFGAFPSKHPLT